MRGATGYKGPISLTTDRLLLRHWRPEDLPRFAAMNADPRVMEHFHEHAFGFWAVEPVGVADFAGFVGLSIPGFEPFVVMFFIG